jgi:hypothetical protein
MEVVEAMTGAIDIGVVLVTGKGSTKGFVVVIGIIY